MQRYCSETTERTSPGFEQRTEKGERMACHVHVGMQGRIDATRLFGDRLFALLAEGGVTRCMWDPQLCIFPFFCIE